MSRYVCMRPDYGHCEKDALKKEIATLQAKVEELEAERDKFGHALEKIKSFNDHNFSLSDAHIVAKAALLTGGEIDPVLVKMGIISKPGETK